MSKFVRSQQRVGEGVELALVDDFRSGRREFVAELLERPGVRLLEGDVLDSALMRDAVADHPEDGLARVEFFRAAQAAGHNQLALSAVEPLLSGQASQFSYRPVLRYATATSEMAPQNYPQFLTGLQLSPAQKASLARAIAHACEKLNDLGEAENYLGVAADFEASKPARAAIESELRDVRARIQLMNRDAQRRPFASGQLEQRNTVRPRLLPLLDAKGGPRP